MKLIPLIGKYGSVVGNYAQVSDEDYEHLIQWKWRAWNSHEVWYAIRSIREGNKVKRIHMHRVIMNPPQDKCVDHINGDGLNNTRENLRIATTSQNGCNRKANNQNTISKYKGVTRQIERYKNKVYINWIATCRKTNEGEKKVYKKMCKTEEEAALAYNEMAIKHHGEFARVNIINT